MTMSKVQFAALLLTAGAVGAGVGWLPHWIHKRKHEAPPQVTVGPIVVPPVPSANDEFKALMAASLEALLAERQAAPAPREIKPPVAAEVKAPVRYKGKPASEWLALYRDRDPETRKKAIEPLAAIAEVDRSMIPTLIEGLKDKNEEVRRSVARQLESVNPPARETVPLLFHSDFSLSSIRYLLQQIDPKGEVTVPLAQAALQDEKLKVRAACILLARDKAPSLPTPLLVKVLAEDDNGSSLWDSFAGRGSSEPSGWDSFKALAAWQLWQNEKPSPEAVPILVAALRECITTSRSDSPFISALKTKNEADWVAATLARVDPEGEDAIPALVKMIGNSEYSQGARRNAAHVLGQYGSKAKSAATGLRELLKNKKALSQSSQGAAYVPVATVDEPSDPTRPLREAITETLNKIDPKPGTTKEAPGADGTPFPPGRRY